MKRNIKRKTITLITSAVMLASSFVWTAPMVVNAEYADNEIVTDMEMSNYESNMVELNSSNFPDAAFREYLKQNFDQDNDNLIDVTSVSMIRISGMSEIKDLTGLNYFTNLQIFMCDGAFGITSLDLSSCESLSIVYCYNNNISSLKLGKLDNLWQLDCSNTNITSLDLSQCESLRILNCRHSALQELKLNSRIENLDVADTNVSNLNIENNRAISSLNMNYNCNVDITYTNLSALGLYVDDWIGCMNLNNIKGLKYEMISDSNFNPSTGDLKYNVAEHNNGVLGTQIYYEIVNRQIEKFRVISDKVLAQNISVDVQELNLTVGEERVVNVTVTPENADDKSVSWFVYDSNVATVDETGKIIAVGEGATTVVATTNDGSNLSCNINVSVVNTNEAKDTTIELNATNFPDSAFRSYLKETYDADNDNFVDVANISEINVSYRNDIKDLTGLNYFTNLSQLYCEGTSITTLDVSGLVNLYNIQCGQTKIREIKGLKDCRNLIWLSCINSDVEKLDLSGCTKLTRLACSYTNIKSLDISNCRDLIILYCIDTKITSLDVTACKNLEELEVSANNISSINVNGLEMLKSLSCCNTNITSLDVSKCENLTSLSCTNAPLKDLKLSMTLNSIDVHNTDLKTLNFDNARRVMYLELDYDCAIDISYLNLSTLKLNVNNKTGVVNLNNIKGLNYGCISDSNFNAATGNLNYSLVSHPYEYWGVMYEDIYYDIASSQFDKMQISTENILADKINLDKHEIVLSVGSKSTLNANIFPRFATNKNITWSVDNPNVATVDSNGTVTAIGEGTAIVTATMNDVRKTAETCKVTVQSGPVKPQGGIFVPQMNKDGIIAGMVTETEDKENCEFSWYATNDDGQTWTLISDWQLGNEWLNWVPDKFGDYIIVGKVRKNNTDTVIEQYGINVSFHPHIKGKCQMPYEGPGGGYLIGIESFDNPDQSYSYEMLVLDCTLLAEGKDAWIYTTGKCGVTEGNALWTIWQPQYGYYWTLFRVYDKNDVLIDQECYGFVNAY